MKKILSMLGAIGLVATSSASVVACGSKVGDSDTSGPSSDDVAKWDAMEIHEFEEFFESTISGAIEKQMLQIQGIDDTLHKLEDWEGWSPQDSDNFKRFYNGVFNQENFQFMKYAIDRIKKDDENFDLLGGEVPTAVDQFSLYINKVLEKDSPIKDLPVIISFDKWKKLIDSAAKVK